MLAQFDLAELPQNSFMPKCGLLQFWIINNGELGMDFSKCTTGDTAQVLYFKNADESVTNDEISAKYSPWKEEEDHDSFPLNGEFALTFTVGTESMGTQDAHWEKTFCELWNKRFPNFGLTDYDDLESEGVAPDRLDLRTYSGCKLGGYPDFAQSDPRGEEDKCGFLLFEMDSNMSGDIMWGDLGIANFFISAEDLANRNFANVKYSWDCS